MKYVLHPWHGAHYGDAAPIKWVTILPKRLRNKTIVDRVVERGVDHPVQLQ